MAGGHLIPQDKNQAYSGVVSLQTMRLAILAGELNHLNIMVSDIGNAYLESYTNEKVVFTARPEFKELEGHTSWTNAKGVEIAQLNDYKAFMDLGHI